MSKHDAIGGIIGTFFLQPTIKTRSLLANKHVSHRKNGKSVAQKIDPALTGLRQVITGAASAYETCFTNLVKLSQEADPMRCYSELRHDIERDEHAILTMTSLVTKGDHPFINLIRPVSNSSFCMRSAQTVTILWLSSVYSQQLLHQACSWHFSVK